MHKVRNAAHDSAGGLFLLAVFGACALAWYGLYWPAVLLFPAVMIVLVALGAGRD